MNRFTPRQRLPKFSKLRKSGGDIGVHPSGFYERLTPELHFSLRRGNDSLPTKTEEPQIVENSVSHLYLWSGSHVDSIASPLTLTSPKTSYKLVFSTKIGGSYIYGHDLYGGGQMQTVLFLRSHLSGKRH